MGTAPAGGAGPRGRSTPAGRWTRRARWLTVATLPGFVIGMVVGEGLASALGHGEGTAPWWVVATAGTAGTLVLVAAPTAGAWCAWRGVRAGEGDPARTVLVVDAGITGVVLALTVLGLLARAVGPGTIFDPWWP